MKRIIFLLLLLVIVSSLLPIRSVIADETCDLATIHYRRRQADYDGWGLHVWGDTPLEGEVTWGAPLPPAGEDDFGLYWVVEMNPGAKALNYIIHRGDEKDPGPDQNMNFSQVGCEIWQVQGKPDQFTDPALALEAMVVKIVPAPPVGENQAILHYRRVKADYDGWGLHIWGPTAVEGITWTNPLLPAGYDDYGIYWIVDMQPGAEYLEYIVHKGDTKDPGPDQKLVFAEKGREIWLIQGDGEQFMDPESAKAGLIAAALGDIKNKAEAHWLSRQYIAWPVKFSRDAVYTLHYDPSGAMKITPDGLQGGQSIPLEFAANTLSKDLAERFPHLWSARMLRIPDEYADRVPEILKGQFAIRAVNAAGEILGVTALQIPGVLDDLYANDESLGVIWEGEVPTLRVWAPTAKSVTLLLYADSTTPEKEAVPMGWDAETGVWSVTGKPEWKGLYYRYDVEVFVRQEGKVVHNLVTDPYAVSLSMNSTRSQIVDLNDPALFPANWQELEKPALDSFTDIMLYELHVRDFSIRDESVPVEQRGTFMAFTHPDSNGMRHLRWLAENGVTHLHLLPTFDIATINEDKTQWQTFDWAELASYPPDSEAQQSLLQAIRDKDGFNWGYDPFHFTVPEGSYSVLPNSYIRILEFRKMVQALNQAGLRVVLDVVYNHTNASGQSEKSVLDRVVPGYYHRLDEQGRVATSTCCQNTATEHAMMRKLMIDSVVTWAKAYKVDGFRFDLMGHHMKADMEAVRAALNALTLEKDGVDGTKIYLYGEGWDFGEVAGNARGVNATQENMAGTGIGTFNDRIRDSVRGGSPFTDPQEQGFATGQYTDPNDSVTLSEASQLNLLLKNKDRIRVSLAGNLADYELINYKGDLVRGSQVKYNGRPAGYAQMPQENIVYVSAHDNETLFDAIQYKAPLSTSLEDRVRMQSLALSLVTFSQGVPFFHAGSELLRSKSMDRDSYDSTDWFNAIDWTLQDNNWGHGLPPKDKNGGNWEVIRDRLGRPELAPSPEHIRMLKETFGKLLQIRKSSPLFRLQTADQIKEQVRFHNTGPDQVPGLIAMSISDSPTNPVDPDYEVIFVLFNADPRPVRFTLEQWAAAGLTLHPALQDDVLASRASFDPRTQTFSLPGRSTVVFVSSQPLKEAPLAAVPTEIAAEPTPQAQTATSEEASAQEEAQPSPPAPQMETDNNYWIAGALLAAITMSAGILAWRKRRYLGR